MFTGNTVNTVCLQVTLKKVVCVFTGNTVNHLFTGNVQLMAEVILYLNLPNSPDRKQKFKDTIYVTQVKWGQG